MIARPKIAKTPREHFTLAADEEFSKFERQERALRQAERIERAAQLRLPIAGIASAARVRSRSSDRER